MVFLCGFGYAVPKKMKGLQHCEELKLRRCTFNKVGHVNKSMKLRANCPAPKNFSN